MCEQNFAGMCVSDPGCFNQVQSLTNGLVVILHEEWIPLKANGSFSHWKL